MKIRIRTKLAAALAVPLVVLVGVVAYIAVQASNDADEARSQTELATLAIGPSGLLGTIQDESSTTGQVLAGLANTEGDADPIATTRQATDDAVAELEQYLDGQSDDLVERFDPAMDVLRAQLPVSRAMWDDFDGELTLENQAYAQEVTVEYGKIIDAFFDATSQIATDVDDSELRNGVELVTASDALQRATVTAIGPLAFDVLSGGGDEGLRTEVAENYAGFTAAEDEIQRLSVGPYEPVATTTDNIVINTLDSTFERYLAGEEIDLLNDLGAVTQGEEIEELSTITGDTASEILVEEADAMVADADSRRDSFLLLAALVVGLALVSSWLAARSITQPLRKLRDEAEDMAERRLPNAVNEIFDTPLGEDVTVPELEPIRVKTRDEVSEVVDVLNEVQDRTLELAADQAVMRRNIADSFVNLGRRNQNLLDRQLEFITELERSETDPDELESLFRLDHLATRMRRNAESLLVLAGVESPRQWSAPVSVEDVVRASFGEVENYQRVQMHAVDGTRVLGEAASAVSHVIAELVENALHFSPPDSVVEIKGRRHEGGYVLAISDDGLGMSADDLERANRRLSGEESYTVAPSRYLGHYVAGNLASRYGIEVSLQDSPAGGVTARVAIPKQLLATAQTEAPARPAVEAPAPAPAVDEPAELDPVPEPAPVDEPVVESELEPVVEPELEPIAEPELEPIAGSDSGTDERSPVETGPVAELDEFGSGKDFPKTLSEALGRGQLDEIDTVPDLTTRIDAPNGSSNGTGLPRRVPGAQRPGTSPTIARGGDDSLRRSTGSEHTEPDSGGTGAGALGFLAGFSSATPSSGPDTTDDNNDPTEENR